MTGGSVEAPGLSDWLGGADAAWPAVDTLDDGDPLVGCYYLASVRELRTRKDKPYLRLELHDRHGAVDGRVWENTGEVTRRVESGSFVGVRGRVQIYRGDRQLKVEEIAPVRVRPEEKHLFLRRSPHDHEAMQRELDARIASIDDPPLRTLMQRLLGAESETGRRFRHAPAAKRNHHAYVGGLLEHTLSVVRLCELLANHYGPMIDRDLLLAGALVHDIGKVREIATEAGFPYTDEGKLLGHILIGVKMVEDAAADVSGLDPARTTLLLHLVASHQGRYEWQSPREPRTLEGLLLHYADDLDAKMHQAMDRVGEVDGEGWTDYDRSFGRDFLRHRPASTDRTGDAARTTDAVDAAHTARARDAHPAPEQDGAPSPPDDTLNLFPE